MAGSSLSWGAGGTGNGSQGAFQRTVQVVAVDFYQESESEGPPLDGVYGVLCSAAVKGDSPCRDEVWFSNDGRGHDLLSLSASFFLSSGGRGRGHRSWSVDLTAVMGSLSVTSVATHLSPWSDHQNSGFSFSDVHRKGDVSGPSPTEDTFTGDSGDDVGSSRVFRVARTSSGGILGTGARVF